MSADDHLASIARSPDAPRFAVGKLGDTPWDPSLANVMIEHGISAYEEALMPKLLDSIARAPW